MTEMRPIEQQREEFEDELVLAQRALGKVREIIAGAVKNPDETTRVMDWEAAQQPVEIVDESDFEEQAYRLDVRDEIEKVYYRKLKQMGLLSQTPEQELEWMLEGHALPQIKSGRVWTYVYLNNQMQRVDLTYTEVDIDGVGIVPSMMTVIDEGEQSVAYTLIDEGDGEIWGMMNTASLLEDNDDEQLADELLAPLPAAERMIVIQILSNRLAPDEVEIALTAIEDGAQEAMDSAELAHIVAKVHQIYQQRQETHAAEAEAGKYTITLHDLVTLNGLLDEKAAELLS